MCVCVCGVFAITGTIFIGSMENSWNCWSESLSVIRRRALACSRVLWWRSVFDLKMALKEKLWKQHTRINMQHENLIYHAFRNEPHANAHHSLLMYPDRIAANGMTTHLLLFRESRCTLNFSSLSLGLTGFPAQMPENAY